MSFDNAFRPSPADAGTRLVVATTSTAGTATQWSTGGMPTCFVVNNGTVPVYLAWGSSTVQAQVPTTSAAGGLALLSTLSRCFQLGPNATNVGWVSAITTAGFANCYITPGYGF